MNPNLLAIIVAFYLSKFNKPGLTNLGFKNNTEAFETTAKILGIKKNYVKFRRDEFDPVHPWRKGWQRPMDKRIKCAIEALQDLDEPVLRQIVLDILDSEEYRKGEEVEQITSLFAEEKEKNKKVGVFILRGPTGRQAEIFFQKYHKDFGKPFPGELIDTRDLGCGYDFEIHTTVKKYFIEVKGLAELSGGILFTNKEWNTAQKKGDDYFLIIVKSLNSMPEVAIIQNPATKINAKRNVYKTVQVQWSVSENELSKRARGSNFDQ